MKTDKELQLDVMAEIEFDPQLKDIATEIGVAVKEGVVTLAGNVDSYARKLAAERAAQRVEGVKVVAVDLIVTLPSSAMKNDAEIALAVKNALSWHSAVNEDEIELKVDEGWVYLDGAVDYDYMKKAAENAVNNLVGVRGVTNRIMVRNRSLDPAEVKRKITAAFHRSATIDSGNIYAEINDGVVTLSGKVRTWAERQDAENAALSCSGVISVNNVIEIDPAVMVS
ncbi:MAG: BON domain-containing protein [Cyclobacteriaceae bacterium]|jgi:osmotically-inducible protein OsmY|nr:BON domain-containing protein [Cyclobacteriaceae bacterium]